jgi:hypothetical protein
MPRVSRLLFFAVLLCGCSTTPRFSAEPALDGSQIPNLPPPAAATTFRDCAEAERMAREIATRASIVLDLDVLTQQLRGEIARTGIVGEVDPRAFPLATGWTYHGDGRRWQFTSGGWLMTMEEEGKGPIRLSCFDSQKQAFACIEAHRVDGKYEFSAWTMDELIVFGYSGFGDAEQIANCEFEIPVVPRPSASAEPGYKVVTNKRPRLE